MGVVCAHPCTHTEARMLDALLAPLRQGFPPNLEAAKPEPSSRFSVLELQVCLGSCPTSYVGYGDLNSDCHAYSARSLSNTATPKPGTVRRLNSCQCNCSFHVQLPALWGEPLCEGGAAKALQADSQGLVEMVTLMVHTIFSKRLFYAEHFPACLI